MLTAKEVAGRLRMPVSTVYHLAQTNRLPAVHLGRTWRFRVKDIEALENGPDQTARILLVDDDVTVLGLVSHLLENAGHEVWTASSVADAERLLRARRFDLLLVDVVLPDRSGVELIRELPPEYPPQRVVLITAYAELSSVDELLSRGEVTILRKPLDADLLLDCVAGKRAAQVHDG
jgi:excisionase family DNA binding protein